MDAEETEDSAHYPYLGKALLEQSKGPTPDMFDRDYVASKALQSPPVREASTLQRYSEDPTSVSSDKNEGPESESYISPSSCSTAPGMEVGHTPPRGKLPFSGQGRS